MSVAKEAAGEDVDTVGGASEGAVSPEAELPAARESFVLAQFSGKDGDVSTAGRNGVTTEEHSEPRDPRT
ncbi:hypothetical protein ACFO0N_13870 [Halobium salinum]|uniref:Uncharacterized protein n=1 Tax=Halobium salinum TaxID=1364940 RepID=A0ABD5PDX4_9EURY|nr:hypothetical protein [Halobium salinum]